MSRITKMTIIAAVSTAGIVAFAGNIGSDFADVAYSLVGDVVNAEQHTGGKAVKGEFEHSKAGWAYDVEIVNSAKTVTYASTPTREP